MNLSLLFPRTIQEKSSKHEQEFTLKGRFQIKYKARKASRGSATDTWKHPGREEQRRKSLPCRFWGIACCIKMKNQRERTVSCSQRKFGRLALSGFVFQKCKQSFTKRSMCKSYSQAAGSLCINWAMKILYSHHLVSSRHFHSYSVSRTSLRNSWSGKLSLFNNNSSMNNSQKCLANKKTERTRFIADTELLMKQRR